MHATCLNQYRSEAHRQDRSHGRSQRRIYTDGSMNPKKQNAKAGYGIAEYEIDAEAREEFRNARYGSYYEYIFGEAWR